MAAEERRPGPSSVPAERRRQLRGRNWALMIALVAFAVLVYAVAIVRMSGG
jgi:hypothetical protein